MSGLITLICALALAQTGMGASGGPSPHLALGVGLFLGFWLIATAVTAGVLVRLASIRALRWYELASELLALVGFAVLVFGLGWGRQQESASVVLLPWVACQLWAWWVIAPALNRAFATHYTRWGHLLHHARFAILPAALVLPLADLVAAVGNHWHPAGSAAPVGRWFIDHLGQTGNLLASLLVGLVALTLGPWLLVRLWRTRPLPPGPLRDRLLAACAEAGIRLADLRTWTGAGGREYNAMAMGILPAARYVLLSEDLLSGLPPEQVRAVLGHELGHARHGHLLLYLVFLASAGMVAVLVQGAALAGLSHLPPLPFTEGLRPDPTVVEGLVGLAVLVLAWRFGFGALSRRCERQADLSGAAFTDPRTMGEALLAVTRLTGGDPSQPSWHHGSMASRIRFLDELARDPTLAGRHHRAMRRLALLVVLGGIGLALVLAWITVPATLPHP